MAVAPTGLLFCDQVYEDPSSHNVTLLGIFTELFSTKFPTPYRDFSIYALISGDVGEFTELTLSCVSESSREELFNVTRRDQIGRNGKRQVHIRIGELSFPEPGEYRFSILSDGEQIAVQKLNVLERN